MPLRATILLFITTSISVTNAQVFSLKRIELVGDGMVLHYDLSDTIRSKVYTIEAYSSVDNFMVPLKYVSGDVGLDVASGFDRKIVWDSKKELGVTFHGEVELEIRGKPYVPFIKLNSFEEGCIVKRAESLLLTWSGGPHQSVLNFGIYKGNQLIDIIPNVPNSGNYELKVPTRLKPGKDYHFLITDSKNKELVVRTPSFAVRRKIPLVIKAAAAAIVLTTAIVASHGKSNYLDGPPALPGSN